MRLSANFKIEKFYLDCIDDAGNCVIAYWATIEYFVLRFVYSGWIFCDKDGNTTERSSFRKITKPFINKGVEFNNRILKFNASLSAKDAAITHTLFTDSFKNELIWNCHHPKGMVEIRFDGNIYSGYGYSETLWSFIKPWKLPLDELRWGRFLQDSYTVIWIRWKGEYPVNRLFLNSNEYNDAIFEDDRIIFGNASYILEFKELEIIRKSRISRLFNKMPYLKLFFNKRLLNTFEIKFRAKTTLYGNSLPLSDGWSLFEIVTWGK